MRDIDNEIRNSLERLTDPRDNTPGTDALWSDLVSRRRKRRNRNRTLAVLPLLLVAVLAVGILSTRGSSDSARSDVAAGDAGTAVIDRWESLPDAPISARTGAVAIATDDELVIWGGSDDSGALNDGVAYSFNEQTWTQIAEGPLSPRGDAVAVWTGEQVLIWGGTAPGVDGSTMQVNDGASWNPETNTWTSFPAHTGAVAGMTGAAWTGQEAVFLGTIAPGFSLQPSDSWAFDPTTGNWRDLEPTPDTSGDDLRGRRAFTTDRGVLVATITDDVRVKVSLLDPQSGEWTDFPLEWEAQNPINPSDIAWTGTVLVFVNHDGPGTVFRPWDGSRSDIPATGSELRLPAVALPNGEVATVTVGDRWLGIKQAGFEVHAGTWQDTEPAPADMDSSAVTVAHDGELYAWNGNGYVWTPPVPPPLAPPVERFPVEVESHDELSERITALAEDMPNNEFPDVVIPVRHPDGWTLEGASASFPSDDSYGTVSLDYIDRTSSLQPLPAVVVCTSTLPEPDACATGDESLERQSVSTDTGDVAYIVGTPESVAAWSDVEWVTLANSEHG